MYKNVSKTNDGLFKYSKTARYSTDAMINKPAHKKQDY